MSKTAFTAAQRAEIAEIVAQTVVAVLKENSPAKTARTTTTSKKSTAKKATPKAKVTKVTFLCKASRKAFIAAAKKSGTDFSSWSTKAIASACIEDESLIPAGFAIGEGYRTLLG